MTEYSGLSRVYRPKTFGAVLGQDPIVRTLKNAILRKKTAQAYLFCGTRGTGKTTLARILAKALNCPYLTKDCEPCNDCPSCREIGEGRNLNVLEIDGASNRGIEDIRQLNETLAYAPANQGWKIFIIDEAHMLTKEAFNALLKTLEEPPPNVKFFLATTEVHKIPSTILSRCQRFDLQRIREVDLVKKLSEILSDASRIAEEPALYTIAAFADGSMRVAESILDRVLCFSEGTVTESEVAEALGILPSEEFFALDQAFEKENHSFAFILARQIFSSGKDPLHFFDMLLRHYGNLAAVQNGLSLPDVSPSLQEKYRSAANLYEPETLLYLLDYIAERQEKAHKTPCKRISLEMTLLHILRSKRRISAADLALLIEQSGSNSLPVKETISVPNLAPPLPVSEPETQPTIKSAPPVEKQREIPPLTDSAPQKEQEIPSKESTPAHPSLIEQSRFETLTRFAAIELEGSLVKE